MPDLNDRLAGGVWGHLIGDAMGVPYEFGPPVAASEVRWGHLAQYRAQPPGTWSDDGGLMLALLDSLVGAGFDTRDQASRAIAWWLGDSYRPGPLFDIGLITKESLGRIQDGVEPEDAGGADEHHNGNGSLMRILPIALVGHRLPAEELITQAKRASSLTHRHPRSRVACALYVLVARHLLVSADGRSSALDRAFHDVRSSADDEELREIQLIERYPDRTGSGYVVDSFWSGWDAFASARSYEESITRAISYGDDADTTACLAGGLAGIYYGLTGIPKEWVAGMRGKDILAPVLAKLLRLAST